MTTTQNLENYRKMSEPFPSAKNANENIQAFYDEVRELRKKYKQAVMQERLNAIIAENVKCHNDIPYSDGDLDGRKNQKEDAEQIKDLPRLIQLEKDVGEEIEQFNDGFKAFLDGVPFEDQPYYEVDHDQWRVGWAWSQFCNDQPGTPRPVKR